MTEHDKKLDFLHKIAKLGLQGPVKLAGGLAGGLGDALGITSGFSAQGPTQEQTTASLGQSNTAIGGLQGLAGQTLPGATQGLGAQNALSSQLSAMAQGQGPNPAQNQLAQATGANVANQAALMAGQRGSGSNIGLLARQNAQQGAATQQQAAGQAATMGAQQQIAAQNNLANLSGQQVGQAGQAAGAFSTAAGNQLGTLVQGQAAANSTNANTAGQNASATGGLLGSVGGAISSLFAEGGKVKGMADGGISTGGVEAPTGGGSWVGTFLQSGPMASSQAGSGGSPFSQGMQGGSALGNSKLGKQVQSLFSSKSNTPSSTQPSISDQNAAMSAGPSTVGMNASTPQQNIDMGAGPSQGIQQSATDTNPNTNMSVQGSINPDETNQTISQEDSSYEANGGSIRNFESKGDVVKAKSESEKAKKSGNNYSNDTVPAMLSEGEVVIDRNTLADPGPIGQMARAIRSHIERRNNK